MVDCLFDTLCHTAHCDNHTVSLGISVIIEKSIVATGYLVNLFYVVLYDFGYRVVIGIACLAVLEEDIGILCHTSRHRLVGVEGALTELCKCLAVKKRGEILFAESLDFLNLV
ncbi:hypothetical protein IMSAG025_02394 [Muribaculaceae bacterium]|nr:hypothetical protein IMSAG025_02394 [Muribaculaceae bacterium]